MKEILVSKKHISFIDDEDFDKVSSIKWCLHNQGYALSTKGYMHRLIINPKVYEVVDHIDGNPLNNQKSNLRVCIQRENTKNTKIRKNNKTGYKGVSYDVKRNKYEAYITVNYKKIKLGYWSNEREAAEAYNKAATLHFGEFARLNNIKEG